MKYIIPFILLATSCSAVRATQRNARPIGALVAAQALRDATEAVGADCTVQLGSGETEPIDAVVARCVIPAGDVADELLGR